MICGFPISIFLANQLLMSELKHLSLLDTSINPCIIPSLLNICIIEEKEHLEKQGDSHLAGYSIMGIIYFSGGPQIKAGTQHV